MSRYEDGEGQVMNVSRVTLTVLVAAEEKALRRDWKAH